MRARPRTAETDHGSPLNIPSMAGARIGKAAARTSLFNRIARSTSSVASSSNHVSARRTGQPRPRPVSNARPSYHRSWRSIAPMSSIRVLVSMIRSVRVRGSNAGDLSTPGHAPPQVRLPARSAIPPPGAAGRHTPMPRHERRHAAGCPGSAVAGRPAPTRCRAHRRCVRWWRGMGSHGRVRSRPDTRATSRSRQLARAG